MHKITLDKGKFGKFFAFVMNGEKDYAVHAQSGNVHSQGFRVMILTFICHFLTSDHFLECINEIYFYWNCSFGHIYHLTVREPLITCQGGTIWAISSPLNYLFNKSLDDTLVKVVIAYSYSPWRNTLWSLFRVVHICACLGGKIQVKEC